MEQDVIPKMFLDVAIAIAILFVGVFLHTVYYLRKWVNEEDRAKYYVLLAIIFILGIFVVISGEETIWKTVGDAAFTATVTLFFVHLAHVGGQAKMKLLFTGVVGLAAVVIGAVALGRGGDKDTIDMIVTLAVGQLIGFLDCCIFETKTTAHSDKTQS